MGANFINFVTELIYGDAGAAELSLPAATNHMTWTLDRLATPPTAPGDDFLSHHLDMMLNRHELWREKYNLPPLTPWDGSQVFFEPMMPTIGMTVPVNLNGTPFPGGWTTDDLGTEIETYYHSLRNYEDSSMGGTELTDEIKAPYSFRFWAFMKWASDLRKRLLGQQVFPVAVIYDRDGTILSEREFLDYFHQVHHVWHPNGGEPSWTVATPGFRTGVGQYRRKKHLSRTQIGEEFFSFHRDHLLLLDRWLARTGQDPAPSFNTCGHDLDPTGPSLNPPPAGLDVEAGGMGFPLVDYVTRTVDFTPPHESNWEGTLPGFDGTLREFSSVGEMGQFLATDFNPFSFISVPGAPASDSGYHGEGHVLNGDLYWPVANNYSLRFFAWHGFIDDVWTKRQPVFTKLMAAQADGTDFPSPQVLTILREFSTGTDSVEPAAAIGGIDLTSGNGTLRIKINVRPDPFTRPLNLKLQCDVLREATSSTPVISITRDLSIVVGPPASASEREQGTEFIEDFLFDGSAGTLDSGGKGPFASDNLSMSPTSVGFINSLIRLTAVLTCDAKPDGSVPSSAGTISSSGTNVTGSGTSFTSLFRQGDLIRASGQVRKVITITSNTALTLDEPFTPNLVAGTSYQRLDGFDASQTVEIPLVQEKLAPEISAYLDRSSFSKDQVDAIASSGQSVFDDAFYVMLQDRTQRPAPIVWPSDTKTDLLLPQFYGLIAPPIPAAGLYPDLAHAPTVELLDAMTDTPIPGLSVSVTAAQPEDPSLHPSVPQRITYSCQVVFTGNAMFSGMAAGDVQELKLKITATDRSGNRASDDSYRVRLQINANPYMLDGPTSWLSVDTRVFQIRQGQTRFGVTMGSDPNAYIEQVIDDLRAGNGTAGGESFDSLPQDQPGSALEYSTQVGGVNVYNFTLAKVRLQSVTGASNVRVSFRLFRWGVANVAFDDTLAYRTDSMSGIALLGRTTIDELASIPFFAEPRVSVNDSMTTQTDPKNIFNFPPTGGVEALSFFGAYLDINQSTTRFPQSFTDDGGFGSVPPADMRSIRDLMIGQHQCMVVEIYDPNDPTDPGSTPGTSDNLSQRNLLILETANPGSESTRAIQHSFNIDLTPRRHKHHDRDHDDRNHVDPPDHDKDGHTHDKDERKHHAAIPHGHLADTSLTHVLPYAGEHTNGGHDDDNDKTLEECLECLMPRPARPAQRRMHAGVQHATHFFAAADPALLRAFELRSHAEMLEAARWQFDMEQWKSGRGLDELIFFWNNLPKDSVVELYLPGMNAEEIINYRNLRHAPDTVRIVNSHTLKLVVAGPTYLPIPPFWANDLSGLVTITLPAGIKEGQKFVVDVVQMRSSTGRVLGGFQINIQVSKARRLYERERRLLELFHQRLSLTPRTSRWHTILERQVEFTRGRVRGFIELANDPEIKWDDPTVKQRGQHLRLVLERIQILDDREPHIKGAGEFRFKARVHSRNNGELLSETLLPETGHYQISDKPGENTIELKLPIFDGFIEDHLALEITGIEEDTFDPDDQLCPYRRVFTGSPETMIGSYGQQDEKINPEDLGGWRLWYRIERG